MPWFITSIVSGKGNENSPKVGSTRTFGFYNTYNEAWEAVRENRGNMEECLYDYLVIEYIEPGIHPQVHKEEWYEWDADMPLPENAGHGKWMPTMKPMEFEGIVNWALG